MHQALCVLNLASGPTGRSMKELAPFPRVHIAKPLHEHLHQVA